MCRLLGLLVQAVLRGCVWCLKSRCDFRLSGEDINERAALLCRKMVHFRLFSFFKFLYLICLRLILTASVV